MRRSSKKTAKESKIDMLSFVEKARNDHNPLGNVYKCD